VSRPRRGRTLTPAAAMVLAVLALLVLAWLLAQPAGVTPLGTPYQNLPAIRIWAAVAAGSMIISVGMVVALWRADPAWKTPDNGWRRWTPPLLYAALAVATYSTERGLSAMDLTPALPTSVSVRSGLVNVVGALAAAPSVLGLWAISARLRELTEQLADPKAAVNPAAVMPLLLHAGRQGQRYLVALTVIISVKVLTAGVLRKALLAAGYPPDELPSTLLLLHGLFLTAWVLAVYLPFYLNWHAWVARIVEASYPLPQSGLPTNDWVDDRSRLEQVLHGNDTLKQNLTAAFAVLAPFGGSLIGLIIPELKGH
jgi:hypothetical protein